MKGFDTLQEIEQAIGDARRQEELFAQKLEADNQAHAQILKERLLAIRELAQARAHGAVADGVIDEADRLNDEVAMILSARVTMIHNLTARHADLEARQKDLLVQSSHELQRIASQEADLDRVAETARTELSADADYRDLVARLGDLEGQRKQAAAKAEQAKADRIEKGKPYESDPLFMYLWRRGYRGKDYTAHPIVRWLDGWVAGLVGFNAARANYALLNEIPERLEAHVARLDADHARLKAERADKDAEKIRAIVGTDLLMALETSKARLKDIDASLSAAESELNAVANQLNHFAKGLDDSFRTAVETLAGFLEHERYNALVDAVRTTPDTSDDVIVARIGEFNRKSEALQSGIRERRAEIEKLAKRREELIRVAADFRRKSYHQPGSIFEPDYDMEDLMRDVLRGALTVAEYWVRAQARQRWQGRSGDSYRRSSGSPPFEFPDFGRGSRGGRRGRRDDDDFRTGGGF